MLIGYYCETPKKKPKGFTHLIAPAEACVPLGSWFTFAMEAAHGTIMGMVNGQPIASARIPRGTRGMPGFLINQLEDCVVRVRDIKIRFLNPTRQQIAESQRHPLFNWLRHKESVCH
jgi:hypothetical protein